MLQFQVNRHSYLLTLLFVVFQFCCSSNYWKTNRCIAVLLFRSELSIKTASSMSGFMYPSKNLPLCLFTQIDHNFQIFILETKILYINVLKLHNLFLIIISFHRVDNLVLVSMIYKHMKLRMIWYPQTCWDFVHRLCLTICFFDWNSTFLWTSSVLFFISQSLTFPW